MAESIANKYADMPADQRIDRALEMATEIHKQNDRVCALSAALRAQLEPCNGEESPDHASLCLAELLEELLSEASQRYRLIDCLQAMQSPATTPALA